VAANFSEVVGTTASKGDQLGICIFLNIHFIECAVAIVLYPEYNTAHEFVVFNQFNKTHSMNFLSSPDHLVGTVIVYVLNDVW
jgi:hypothetical protein